MTKDKLIEILENRRLKFKQTGCNLYEMKKMQQAIDIIKANVPPEYFECEHPYDTLIIKKDYIFCNSCKKVISIGDTL